ncbi:MAG: GNAT family N-acetyltransferase [bacterium]|nr:GNAT family N-acetyltransferase [bacterium]
MSFSIRPARANDIANIAVFTANTFEWGDYVADELPGWLADVNGQVMVAADHDDVAVAMGRGLLLSPTEMWFQGARVSEPWRRRGIASAIGDALGEWAKERQARVARLVTESWNTPAQRQVEAIGFKARGNWVMASRQTTDVGPTTATNGGQRAKAHRKLELAHSSEAIPAWVSWRSGPLAGPSRGLHVHSWRWAQLTVDALEAAAKEGALWSSQTGWVTARRNEDRLSVGWLDCGPDDARDMIKSLVDLAFETRAERLQVTVPELDWLVAGLQSSGCELHPMIVYERPL